MNNFAEELEAEAERILRKARRFSKYLDEMGVPQHPRYYPLSNGEQMVVTRHAVYTWNKSSAYQRCEGDTTLAYLYGMNVVSVDENE